MLRAHRTSPFLLLSASVLVIMILGFMGRMDMVVFSVLTRVFVSMDIRIAGMLVLVFVLVLMLMFMRVFVIVFNLVMFRDGPS